MEKMATLKQAGKLLELFGDMPAEDLQCLLASGFLTVLRDAQNIEGIDMEAFRRVVRSGSILSVDRSKPFNPARFLEVEGWSIWKGPVVDGDGFSGDEDQDKRSLTLTELDTEKIQLVTCITGDETIIEGERKILCLKKLGCILLDAIILQELWEHKEKIPKSWKEKTNGNTTHIFFDGTILRWKNGIRCVLGVFWDGWRWHLEYRWLELSWDSSAPSAVLASPAAA